MSIHTLQDLCYAYRVAEPVREMLFALQDRITELEAQKLQDRNAMDAMKLANEQWTQECRRLEKQLIAQRKPLSNDEIALLYMSHTDRPLKAYWEFARAIEQAHGIKESI